jgi:hypothetical protein
MSAHPGVRRAEAAIVRHDGQDVAIAAAEPSEHVSEPILRNHVRRELGEDSGLAGVLIVEHMPMTGGAVDAGYLASAVAEGRGTLFEDPHDDLERRVAAIWSDQMDLRSVGVHDDFLDLGSDSLPALGIIAAIEDPGEPAGARPGTAGRGTLVHRALAARVAGQPGRCLPLRRCFKMLARSTRSLISGQRITDGWPRTTRSIRVAARWVLPADASFCPALALCAGQRRPHIAVAGTPPHPVLVSSLDGSADQ